MKTFDEMKKMLKETNGKFFTVVFTKVNGEKRKMLCRTGVKKGVKGTGAPEAVNVVKVYDVQAKGFRSINLDTLESFKCGSKVWTA